MGVEQEPIRLMLVEDEGLYREMLATCLANEPTVRVAGSYASPDQALAEAEALQPQVAILDFEMPGSMHGIELGLALRRRISKIGVVLLSNHAVPHLLSTLPPEVVAGWAYMVKRSVADVATLVRAIHAAASGIVAIDSSLIGAMRPRSGSRVERLAPQQREVLELVAQGYSDLMIANVMRLPQEKVASSLEALYTSLSIDSTDRFVQPRVRAVLAYLQETRMRWSALGGLPAAS